MMQALEFREPNGLRSCRSYVRIVPGAPNPSHLNTRCLVRRGVLNLTALHAISSNFTSKRREKDGTEAILPIGALASKLKHKINLPNGSGEDSSRTSITGDIMEAFTIEFIQWSKWNPRKDVKSPTWFAMSNRITEDDQIQTLTDAEFRAFVHMICLASQQKKSTAFVNLAKAERVTGIRSKTFLNTAEKLTNTGICNCTYGSRTRSERHITLQDTTRQDITKHNTPAADAFERAFEKYPLRVKGQNAERRFAEQIKTPEAEAEFHQALENYKAMLAIETWRKPKQTFATFLGTKSSGFFWRDFIDWKAPASKDEKLDDYLDSLVRQREEVSA